VGGSRPTTDLAEETAKTSRIEVTVDSLRGVNAYPETNAARA
jgi:hypothetical protein